MLKLRSIGKLSGIALSGGVTPCSTLLKLDTALSSDIVSGAEVPVYLRITPKPKHHPNIGDPGQSRGGRRDGSRAVVGAYPLARPPEAAGDGRYDMLKLADKARSERPGHYVMTHDVFVDLSSLGSPAPTHFMLRLWVQDLHCHKIQ